MASLNWAHLNPPTQSNPLRTPIPLPREKVVLTLSSITLHLTSLSPTSGPPRTAQGTLYLSTQRIIFISDTISQSLPPPTSSSYSTSTSLPALSNIPPPSTSTTTPTSKFSKFLGNLNVAVAGGSVGTTTPQERIESLSIPLKLFQKSGRLCQPWISATYYEIQVSPADGGGLLGDHNVRFSFREAGGFQFFEAIESLKVRLARSAVTRHVEPLPLYQSSGAENATSPQPTPAPAPAPIESVPPPIGQDERPPGYAP